MRLLPPVAMDARGSHSRLGGQACLRALLTEARERAKIKKQQIADHVGKPQSLVGKYERGVRRREYVELLTAGHAIEANPRAFFEHSFANNGRSGDQHDAFSIAAWLSRADRDGSLAAFLNPELLPPERTLAQVEGRILAFPA